MIDEPDFAQSRRQLRRARIQDAVQLRREGFKVRTHRDRLLEILGVDSLVEIDQFGHLDEEQVDSIVSLALAVVPEPTDSSINVLLVCLKVLVQDGQFARVSALAVRLNRQAALREVDRPYWASALAGYAQALQGNRTRARADLDRTAGGGDILGNNDRGRQHLDDLLALAVMRSCATDDSWADLAERAIEISRRRGNGELLTFLDAVIAWRRASDAADPLRNLATADPTFTKKRLENYISRRGVSALFPAQVLAIQAGATRDDNRLISLPTSSGKTLIAELRIAAALTRFPAGKAIYVAPYRLLSRQVMTQLRHLERLGLRIEDLGDGYDPTAESIDTTADVLVCTPERLDALLRLASSDAEGHEVADHLFRSCAVIVFDELHLLGRSGRGIRFELLITRLRSKHDMPILGLSAAAQQSDRLAEWLGDDERIRGARRPTGTVEILWTDEGELIQRIPRKKPAKVGNIARSSRAIDAAATLLARLADDYAPVLAICTTRQNAESLAKRVLEEDPLAGEVWRANLSRPEADELSRAVQEVSGLLGVDHPLAMLLESGIAFHHAGLPTHVLRRVERLAKQRIVRAVSATTTVAEGADLPFLAVVIPHLNFPGDSQKLERDLYLNIVGRAGRANVAVEGMVFVLDSSARTLRGWVRGELWSDQEGAEISGRLSQITPYPRNVDEMTRFLEFQSQVMAWLGDGGSYVADQAQILAAQTFSFGSGGQHSRNQIVHAVDSALEGLEDAGFAVAGSPYRLTASGNSARLTGLSTPSITRLNASIRASQNGWMANLSNSTSIGEDSARHIAELVFEAVEVYEHSIAARRLSGSRPAEKLRHIQAFCAGLSVDHYGTPEFAADIDLLSAWIGGKTYGELADLAPTYTRANALFGGTDRSKRVSDAADYVGKLAYPACWVWSAGVVLHSGPKLPTFVRGAIELGLPSEAAVAASQRLGVTRSAALTIAELGGGAWRQCRDWLRSDSSLDDLSYLLTLADLERVDRHISNG